MLLSVAIIFYYNIRSLTPNMSLIMLPMNLDLVHLALWSPGNTHCLSVASASLSAPIGS